MCRDPSAQTADSTRSSRRNGSVLSTFKLSFVRVPALWEPDRDLVQCPHMTKLLTEVIRQIVELPEDRQDDAARVLMLMLEHEEQYRLSDEQLRDVDEAIADVDAGISLPTKTSIVCCTDRGHERAIVAAAQGTPRRHSRIHPEHNADAAERVRLRINAMVRSLCSLPRLGRDTRQTGTREILLPHLPYVIAYHVDVMDEDALVICGHTFERATGTFYKWRFQ